MSRKATIWLIRSLIVEAIIAIVLLAGSSGVCQAIDEHYTPKRAATSVGLTLEVKVAKATGHYL